MERLIQVFESHADAAAADAAFYASITAQARLDLTLDLAARYREGCGEAAERFELGDTRSRSMDIRA
jgi:hypothetical protein